MNNNLERFLNAQADVYNTALAELNAGSKSTHWMWFIFPQIRGLGHSDTARFYAIENAEEANAYMAHPTLANRLIECSQALLNTQGLSARDILGSPDDLKLKSSMTLFEYVTENPGLPFSKVLDRFYEARCEKTLDNLAKA